jgi:hypothetical protein
MFPRLKDNETAVKFSASHRAVVSAGPNLAQAKAHVVAGNFDSPSVTLQLAPPRHQPALALVAVAQVASGNPPRSDVKYQIEFSTDQGATWRSLVRDWTIPRRGQEPPDFWSQSFCYGSIELPQPSTTPVLVRFKNDAGKKYLRAEAHLVYRTPASDETKTTFAWQDDRGAHEESHTFGSDGTWNLATGAGLKMRWVELADVPAADR